ncbi:MAG: ATP-binding protein [Candidatus Asgardarchaeia archaeon]
MLLDPYTWLFFLVKTPYTLIFFLLILLFLVVIHKSSNSFRINQKSLKIDRYSIRFLINSFFKKHILMIMGLKLKLSQSTMPRMNLNLSISQLIKLLKRRNNLSIVYRVENGTVLIYLLYYSIVSSRELKEYSAHFLELEKIAALLRQGSSNILVEVLRGKDILGVFNSLLKIQPKIISSLNESKYLVKISDGKTEKYMGAFSLKIFKRMGIKRNNERNNNEDNSYAQYNIIERIILTFIKESINGTLVFSLRKPFFSFLNKKILFSLYAIVAGNSREDIEEQLEVSISVVSSLSSSQSNFKLIGIPAEEIFNKAEQMLLCLPINTCSALVSDLDDMFSFSMIFLSQYFSRIFNNFSVPESLSEGDIFLGKVLFDGVPVSNAFLTLNDLVHHAVIIGQTGSGKTTLVKSIMWQIIRKSPQINWLIIDFKGEYLDIFKDDKFLVPSNVKIFTPGSPTSSFRINLFYPPSDANSYLVYIYNLIVESIHDLFDNEMSEFSVQMKRVLFDVLKEVILNKNKRSFNALIEELKKLVSKNKDYAKTVNAILNRLYIFYESTLKDVFTFSSDEPSIDPFNLINQKTIIDMSYLREKGSLTEIKLLMNILAKYILSASLSKGFSNLHFLFVVEEAQFLVPEIFKRRTSSDFTTVESMIHIERAYGVGIIAISTRMSISENLLANAGVKIFFRNDIDKQKMSSILSLDTTSTIPSLPFYHAIVSHYREPKPFILRIEKINKSSFKLNISDLIQENNSLFTKSFSPPPPYIMNGIKTAVKKGLLSFNDLNTILPKKAFTNHSLIISEETSNAFYSTLRDTLKKILENDIVLDSNDLLSKIKHINLKSRNISLDTLKMCASRDPDITYVDFLVENKQIITLFFLSSCIKDNDPIEVYMADKFIELCRSYMLLVDESIGNLFDGSLSERYVFKALNTEKYSIKTLSSILRKLIDTTRLLGYEKLIVIIPKKKELSPILNNFDNLILLLFSEDAIRKFLHNFA